MRRLLPLIALFLVACGECGDDTAGTPGRDADAGDDSRFRTEPDMGIKPCFGCIDESGDCVAGDSEDACGEGGARCGSCEPGTACVDDGQCAAPPSCGPDTCDGCCNADDECVDGTSEDSCGADGNGCAACPERATCTDGACALGCGPDNCDGCCDASGECVTTTSDTACGAGGAACEDCTRAGGTCGGPACVTTTCSDTCAGCCAGDTCVDPVTDAQCGASGASCVMCGESQTCNAGVCESAVSGEGLWDVVILSADIAPQKPNGSGWDTFAPLPEVFVEVGVPDGSGYFDIGTTSVVPETLTPVWEETVLTAVPEARLTEYIGFVLIDQDDVFDDEICFMELSVDQSMLQGMIVETPCDIDPGTRLRWRLDPH